MSEKFLIHEKFSVITEFGDLNHREIRVRSKRLRNVYFSDLKSSLDDDFVHFHAYCTEKMMERNSPSDLLTFLRANELYIVSERGASIPNICHISCNELQRRTFIFMSEKG